MQTPQQNFIVLTESTRIAIVTPGGVWVIDRETGKTEFKPEMPILEHFEAVRAATDILRATQHVRGTEELRLQVAKFLVSFVEKADEAILAKISHETEPLEVQFT